MVAVAVAARARKYYARDVRRIRRDYRGRVAPPADQLSFLSHIRAVAAGITRVIFRGRAATMLSLHAQAGAFFWYPRAAWENDGFSLDRRICVREGD